MEKKKHKIILINKPGQKIHFECDNCLSYNQKFFNKDQI